MTLSEYFSIHRMQGLRRLADETGCKLGYLQQLLYVPTKKPSMTVATRLIKASNGELTYEGLANPIKKLVRQPKQIAN